MVDWILNTPQMRLLLNLFNEILISDKNLHYKTLKQNLFVLRN